MSEPRTLAHEIADVLRAEEAELLRLAKVRERHQKRREGKSDHPPFEQVEK
jgi:hypothetical protein